MAGKHPKVTVRMRRGGKTRILDERHANILVRLGKAEVVPEVRVPTTPPKVTPKKAALRKKAPPVEEAPEVVEPASATFDVAFDDDGRHSYQRRDMRAEE